MWKASGSNLVRMLKWRVLGVAAAIAAGGCGCLRAQVSVSLSTAGPSLTIADAPFEAERVTKTARMLSDGSKLEREEHEHLYRDKQGRVFDESVNPVGGPDGQPSTMDTLFDPVEKHYATWNKKTKVGSEQALTPAVHVQISVLAPDRAAEASQFPKNKTTVTTSDLGQKQIHGLLATGHRTSTVLAAGAMGNSADLKQTRDVWTSDDLQLVLEETDSSPLTGTRTVEVMSLRRGDPNPAVFEMPKDLSLKEIASMADVMAHLPGAEYTKAIDGLKDPDTRETSAAWLINYEQTHVDNETHIAFLLALWGTHLEQAESMAREAVHRDEEADASATAERVTVGDVLRMVVLAEAWDALGWALWKKGDKDQARLYCTLAWQLGGEGIPMWHLGDMSVDAGQPDLAKHQYMLALGGGKMTEAELLAVKDKLIKLGMADPYALHEPTVITLPSQNAGRKAAVFWLAFAAKSKPAVKFSGGDDTLALLAPDIASATYPRQLPDDGPEQVVRRGRLLCDQVNCKLTLDPASSVQPKPKAGEPPPASPAGATPDTLKPDTAK